MPFFATGEIYGYLLCRCEQNIHTGKTKIASEFAD